MSDSAFFDTNILVYAHDGGSPSKQARAQDLIKAGLRDRSMVLSIQVFCEYYVVATRKLGISPVDALRMLHLLSRARLVEPTLATVFEAIRIEQSSAVSYWDALIVASAAAAGCPVVYTEDLAHGREIAGVRAHNPFADLPA